MDMLFRSVSIIMVLTSAAAYATPSTYMIDGRQYVVVCAGGGGKNGTKSGDSVVAFAHPVHPAYGLTIRPQH